MKKIIIGVFVLCMQVAIGQQDLNGYKYIIVPKKLVDFSTQNQYQTSTLLKHYFVEKGFTTVYDDALPQDLLVNRCLGLVANLEDSSTMFSTKVVMTLKDCNNVVVYSTPEARTKIKEYNEAYKAVIEQAMRSLDGLSYAYNGDTSVSDEVVTLNFRNDVKSLDAEEKKNSVVQKNMEQEAERSVARNSAVIHQTSTTEHQSYINKTPVVSDRQIVSKNTNIPAASSESEHEVWYAQPIASGYQLVDSTPKVRMTLMYSSTEDIFIGEAGEKRGMVFKKGDAWVFEYYQDKTLQQETMYIKF